MPANVADHHRFANVRERCPAVVIRRRRGFLFALPIEQLNCNRDEENGSFFRVRAGLSHMDISALFTS
ncbi:MAG TPA: hypothetical protein VEI95_16835, partial [Acidobacteriota bacterium]|nr:hypothetical protein [Acidobacteriota bacterium]